MLKHTKIYLKHFNYDPHEDTFIPCELCGKKAQDIHHLSPRGMGGSKTKDYIENLIALCREHHNDAEAHRIPEGHLRITHLNFIEHYAKS